MGTMEAKLYVLVLIFYLFFGRRNNTIWILEVTRTSRMHKNSLQAGTYQTLALLV